MTISILKIPSRQRSTVVTATICWQAPGNSGSLLNGEAGEDNLSTDSGKNTLLGGDGNDSITGGAGADMIDGQNGNDTIFGLTAGDTLTSAGRGSTRHGLPMKTSTARSPSSSTTSPTTARLVKKQMFIAISKPCLAEAEMICSSQAPPTPCWTAAPATTRSGAESATTRFFGDAPANRRIPSPGDGHVDTGLMAAPAPTKQASIDPRPKAMSSRTSKYSSDTIKKSPTISGFACDARRNQSIYESIIPARSHPLRFRSAHPCR